MIINSCSFLSFLKEYDVLKDMKKKHEKASNARPLLCIFLRSHLFQIIYFVDYVLLFLLFRAFTEYEFILQIRHKPGLSLRIRIGIHTGPCAAGVLYIYHLNITYHK